MDLFFFADRKLFLFLNHLPHAPFFDTVAMIFSGVGTAGIIWFIIALIIFLKEEKKNHWFFAPFLSAGILSWILSDVLIKPFVARMRPASEMGALIVVQPLADYSFPSGHATIAFAAATVLSRIEPRWAMFLYVLAFLISFSRIYLGVHYPLDVIAGAVLGIIIGWLSLTLENFVRPKSIR